MKPTLFQHGELYDLEESSGLPLRLAFIGLWCYSDREGRFEWKPRELKLNILPYDPVEFADVLDALERGQFIKSYIIEGKRYGWIPSFIRHQQINNREAPSSIPAPDSDAQLGLGQLASDSREDRVTDASGTRHEGNGIEGNRMELNREEQKHLVEGGRARPLPAIKGKRTLEAVTARLAQVMGEVSEGTRERLQRDQLLVMQAEMIFSYWAAKTGHEKSIFDAKRERQIIKMLEMNGGDVSELLYVVDGALRDDTIQGKRSDSTRKYDGIETIFRDRAQVERLAGIVKAYREGKTHKLVEKYSAAVRGELPEAQS